MVKSHRVQVLTYTSLILLLIIFILVNIFNNLFFKAVRFDFSAQKVYTLSAGSREILAAINEPINIKLYFSKKSAQPYPYLVSYAARVQELLLQYKRASHGKLIINIIDTEPFTETEDQAVNYGLQGIPVDGNGSELYFGLVATNAVASQEVIAFLQPTRETYLEYDISQMLYKLTQSTTTKIGLLTDLPMQGDPAAYQSQFAATSLPWVIWQQLKSAYDITKITADNKTIPADITILLLANTQDVTAKTAYMIDQFIMRGGHLLALLDPQEQSIKRSHNAQDQAVNNLAKLLHAWGVTIPSKIFTCPKLSKQIRYSHENKEYITNYPVLVDLTVNYFNKDDILTSNLEKITLSEAGVINKNNDATTTILPLITADGNNMLISKASLTRYRDNPQQLIKEFNADHKKHLLAARITGKMQSAFPEYQQQPDHLSNTDHSNIILFANTSMLHDNLWVNTQNFMGNRLYLPTSGNGGLILNAIDNLRGSNALISIRNRGTFSRPFSTILELQAKSRLKYRLQEDMLMQSLEQTKQKLIILEQQKKDSNSIAVSLEQKREEEAFRSELVETRRKLRNVQHAFNKDIEIIELLIKFINIALMPLLVFCAGNIFWLHCLRTKQNKYSKLLNKTTIE